MEEHNTVLKCQVCGLSDFEKCGKRMLCLECGATAPNELDETCSGDSEPTQSDIDECPSSKIGKRKWNIKPRRVKRKRKTIKEQITINHEIEFEHYVSYYNYIVHELADELISLGAKKEFKPIVLQLWIAFLRSKNIAFLNDRKASSRKETEIDDCCIEDDLNNGNSSTKSPSSGCTNRNRQLTKLSLRGTSKESSRKLRRNAHADGKSDVNMLNIYAILAIALNLIEDDIQLCDLIRFIADDHIRPYWIAEKFPRDIIVKLCKDSKFKITPSYTTLRTEINSIATLIGIKKFANPDLKQLVSRYLKELNLPTELGVYIERLITIFPPEMKTRNNSMYPAYEARAMAYIIFALKLLFGLDGVKEHTIDNSAKIINDRIDQIDDKSSQIVKLFIWSNWVEYIEMRKILLAKTNLDMKLNQRPKLIESIYLKDTYRIPSHNKTFKNMKLLLSEFLEKNNSSMNRQSLAPSLLPSTTCLDHMKSNWQEEEVPIPQFMYTDHTILSVKSYIDPSDLHIFFTDHNMPFFANTIASKAENCKFVGIFRAPTDFHQYQNEKADFEISFGNWADSLPDFNLPNLLLETELTSYKRNYFKSTLKYKMMNMRLEPKDTVIKPVPDINESEYMHLNAFDVFKDDNMNPIDVKFHGPRRNLDNVVVFKDVDLTKFSTNEPNESNTLNISKFDIWTLLGYTKFSNGIGLEELEKIFPDSFFWLLKTCAECIGVDWTLLYEQVLVLETLFLYGFDNLDTATDCIHIKYNYHVKQVNGVAKLYNEIV